MSKVFVFKQLTSITEHHEFIVAPSRSDAEALIHKMSGRFDLVAVIAKEVFDHDERRYRLIYRSQR